MIDHDSNRMLVAPLSLCAVSSVYLYGLRQCMVDVHLKGTNTQVQWSV